MNYIILAGNRHRLVARNEGKIKSYESCSDIRAWSHDGALRDRYLREWMKCDMPICVIPVYTLTSFLKNMTYRSRRRAMPKCHPDCKSKVILESICSSCHMMKECLKNNRQFEKYFEEEEFETCHWPCKRCLEVLKTIKMFWKVIVDRIFNINSNSENFCGSSMNRTDSVKSIAKTWEKQMVEEALFVKNISSLSKKRSSLNSNDCCRNRKHIDPKTDLYFRNPIPCKIEKEIIFKHDNKNSRKSQTMESDHILNSSASNSNEKPIRGKLSRCTSVRVKMVNKSCDTCNIEKEYCELQAYKCNLEYLQQRYNRQLNEMDLLKKENNSLKLELHNIYNRSSWNNTIYNSVNIPSSKNVIPKPFDNCVEINKNEESVKNFDSEMIITMKTCKNESYRHVSLLKVLHKTNDPVMTNSDINRRNDVKENPIDILTKVQNTFVELVRREIIVNKTSSNTDSQIHASFYRVTESKSAPSCSTILSDSFSAQSYFVSAKDQSDKADA
ncbi:uncharacterized protein LOC131852628 [Achroia grisella]|uniref:uncharacterized protein LOC131852628 n=1 Tax=Achroia grisella TaxID=688607 RepID=UPI0027D2BDBB|nr:uncharacterized protein LOC131852628 [Achroia grisella]XP_059059306.1 uncharacterized protein LOC131852628 [Achroia grisella]